MILIIIPIACPLDCLGIYIACLNYMQITITNTKVSVARSAQGVKCSTTGDQKVRDYISYRRICGIIYSILVVFPVAN